VVLYHLWPNRLPAGFVGVDIFFVISGYLITGHLFKGLTTGRIHLASFWSRRAIRLLPSSCLVLAVTAVGIALWAPRNLWNQFLGEVVSSTLYVQNWNLARSSIDYLNQDNGASPVQHFWSLSVEEQFYVALPLLLVAVLALSRRLNLSPTAAAKTVLVVIAAVSLAYSIVETATAPGPAYFSTATRAWEFAAGGIAATVVTDAARASSRRLRATLTLTGAALLAVSLIVITPSLPFPSYVAALPVSGAFLVVAFGGGTVAESLGRLAPVAFLGRVSYALYLWHWPGIVILPFVTHHTLTGIDKIAIAVGALLLAWLTTRFIEEPLRFAPRTKSWRPRRVFALGLGAMLVSIAVASTSLVVLTVQSSEARAFARSLESGEERCFGAAALIASPSPCDNPRLRSVFVPDVSNLATDDANRNSCWSPGDSTAFNVCTLGKKTGYSKRFFAVGDSHNNALIDAYERIARQNGWRIDVAGRGTCYWTTASQKQLSSTLAKSCTDWKARVDAYIESADFLDAVLVTHSAGSGLVIPRPEQSRAQTTVDGLVGAWSKAVARGIPIVAIRDNPRPEDSTATCVAEDLATANARCSIPRADGLRYFDGQAQAAARVKNARVIDLTQYVCTATECPVVIGGVIVYRDGSHLTRTFISTLTPYLDQRLRLALTSLGV
jgi:peptidoglycan/LPS O-acetylase OafA/YrhL